MDPEDAADQLNAVASSLAKGQTVFKTTEELRHFFANVSQYASKLWSPELQSAIDAVVAFYPTVGVDDRRRITGRLNRHSQNALLRYANSQAALAAKRNSADPVVNGLMALAIEGGSVDIRDSIMALTGLKRAAEGAGADVPRLFQEIADLIPADGPRQMNTDLRTEMRRFAPGPRV